MPTTPEFNLALAHYDALVAQGRDKTPEGHRAFSELLRVAPQEVLDKIGAMAREMDLIPKPVGLDVNGKPVYRLSDVCEKLGSTEAEAREFLAETGGEGLVSGPIMRAH